MSYLRELHRLNREANTPEGCFVWTVIIVTFLVMFACALTSSIQPMLSLVSRPINSPLSEYGLHFYVDLQKNACMVGDILRIRCQDV